MSVFPLIVVPLAINREATTYGASSVNGIIGDVADPGEVLVKVVPAPNALIETLDVKYFENVLTTTGVAGYPLG